MRRKNIIASHTLPCYSTICSACEERLFTKEDLFYPIFRPCLAAAFLSTANGDVVREAEKDARGRRLYTTSDS